VDEAQGHAAYRELFRHAIELGMVDDIRRAVHGNDALGNDLFAEQIEAALGQRAKPGKAGRPRKADRE